MIYTELKGRLGNDLFRLAATLGLAKKYNDEVQIIDEWRYAKYFEGQFKSGANKVTDIYRDPYFHYVVIPYRPGMEVNGLFQSEKYFEHCRKYIKQQLKPVPVCTPQVILPNSCFIHVRRGDYVGLPQHHPLQTWDNYYAKAVEKMNEWSPARYYIFSDDIDSIEKEFPHRDNFEFIKGNDDMTDFYLMTKCQHAIIGNSSYSWWTAYLSEYKDGQVIAPSNWFGPAYWHYNTDDLYLDNWIKI